ncbi:DUF6943 family protein [Flavobacterium faecale]|uniref:DUF6943 family protein n=1 Tax=Flavobacterium faecale TaxID=1355330 RepID=UPI003AAED9A6
MTFHNVITFQPLRAINQPHFFILSKGKNAGKPIKESCPNCFLITIKNEEESEKLYWLAYTLWKSNFWHQYQIGSVIPFIRISTFKINFRNEVIKAYKKHQKHQEFVNRIRQLETLQQHYSNTIEQIEKLKWVLLQNQLR